MLLARCQCAWLMAFFCFFFFFFFFFLFFFFFFFVFFFFFPFKHEHFVPVSLVESCVSCVVVLFVRLVVGVREGTVLTHSRMM
jgi:hypothetical protein